MGNIGPVRRRFELEPLEEPDHETTPEPAPQPEPVPVPEPERAEPVPA